MKFKYIIELNEGYYPTMEEKEFEVCFLIKTKNRVTADRMVKAMLMDAPNVKRWDGIAVEEDR